MTIPGLAGQSALLRAVTARSRPLQAILAAALLIRLAYVLWGPEVPPQDTADYDEIARNVLSGDGFVARDNWFGYPMRSWRAPLYPFFLAGVYAVAGFSHLAVKVVQALLGSGTVLAVYALSRRLHPGSALLAAAVAAAYGPLVASASEIMTETPFTCLFTWSAYLAVESGTAPGVAGRTWRRDLAAGVGAGLTALARPVGILVWPAALVVGALQGAGSWRAGAAARRAWAVRAAWVSAGVVAAVCPWTIRNAFVHGALVPISTHGGFVIARSNAAPPDWRLEDGWRIREEVFARTPSEVERDRRWLEQGLAAIAGHPGTYLRLAGERFLRFWYFLRPGYNFWFVLVLPFFLLGLRRYALVPGFSALAAVIGLSVAVFSLVLYGSTRFRLPLEPLFIVFAAAYLRDLWDRRGPRVAGAWVGAALVANLAALWQEEALRRGLLSLLTGWGLK